jgi:DNA-binding transcriptional regulator LsrR (DeoR family)
MSAEDLNQSQLATKLGISRVRVNQYLALLKLPQDEIEYILENGKDEIITERTLRKTIISSEK